MSLVDKVSAVKRFSLALIIIVGAVFGGLYLVVAGLLEASEWFRGVFELALAVTSFYFATRTAERAAERAAGQGR